MANFDEIYIKPVKLTKLNEIISNFKEDKLIYNKR